MAEINWIEFLQTKFPKGKIINGKNGKELNIDCISVNCPNPREHMFVNLGSDNPKHDKNFICHRCGFGGNYKTFLSELFELPYDKVIENLSELYAVDEDPFVSVIKASKLLRTKLKLETDKDDEGCIVDLPKEYVRLNKRTAFLTKRDISFNLIRKFKVGICKDGFFKGRLIFPIETNNNRSFLAYSQLSKKVLLRYKKLNELYPDNKLFKWKKKKIINPSKSLHTVLLFNYNNIAQDEKIIFVHEGVTDVFRTILNGGASVGILTSTISEYQAHLLDEKNPEEICHMLDGDVDIKVIERNLEILKGVCESKISIVRLKSGDPDDIRSRNEFMKIIAGRKTHIFDRQYKLL